MERRPDFEVGSKLLGRIADQGKIVVAGTARRARRLAAPPEIVKEVLVAQDHRLDEAALEGLPDQAPELAEAEQMEDVEEGGQVRIRTRPGSGRSKPLDPFQEQRHKLVALEPGSRQGVLGDNALFGCESLEDQVRAQVSTSLVLPATGRSRRPASS